MGSKTLFGVRALVTGGAGFIGSHLVDELIREGCFVRVLDNFRNGKRDNLVQHFDNRSFELVEGSVTEPSDIMRAMKDVNWVFNLACLGVRHSLIAPHENHRVNAEGTLLLLGEAERNKIRRFIHCSSSEVYGTTITAPMTEDHPTYPCTVYGGSKLAGEAYARAYFKTYGMPVVVVRPFNTFGPRSHHEGDAGEMIPKSIVRALAGEPIFIFGDGKQTRDFTYVQDVARGLILAARQDELIGQTVNIGSGEEISINDLAETILRQVNGGAGVKHVESRPGDVLRLIADPTKFMKATDWKAQVGFSQGLLNTVEWFKAHTAGVEKLKTEEIGKNWES